MQVIIPLAGKGTRLRPHTHLVPKPLLKVAGRPVMDWVMDRLEGLDITELIFITGHLKEQVEKFARSHYQIPSRYIEQKVQDGTAGAINLARPYVKGPVLIIFVDTVFEADLTLINRTTADGIIWAKEVEDYQRFGVVVTDAEGYMTRIVEKPSTPISKLANIGLYYIRDTESLWKGIDHVLASPANKGEWYLTDAFQWMIEHGKRILTAEVGGWYDCGKLDTLLETNRTLLEKGAARRVNFPGVTIHDPASTVIDAEVCIGLDTVIAPQTHLLGQTNIGAGCVIGPQAVVQDSTLGDGVRVEPFCVIREQAIASRTTVTSFSHQTSAAVRPT